MAWTEAKEKTVDEVEAKLRKIGGDMLKIEYLENCLKQQLPNDVRREVHLKLADLYVVRLMFQDTAKNLDGAADCATTYKDKMQIYIREAEVLIKNTLYDRAEDAFKKSLACANSKEKEELKQRMKAAYFAKAKEFEKIAKNNNAIKIYERLSIMPSITQEEKEEITKRLAYLYARVGKVQEAIRLEESLRK